MDRRTGAKSKRPKPPEPDRGNNRFKLTSASAQRFDYPIFCLKHLVTGYTLRECDKKLSSLFASKLYFMAQQTWINLENGDHKSGAGFEQIPKEQFKMRMPAIVTEDVSKLHVMRFNGKSGRIVGLRSDEVLHITHIEIDKSAYDHGS